MRTRGLKVLGVSLAMLVLGAGFSSCKSSHELCPAYTKADIKSDKV